MWTPYFLGMQDLQDANYVSVAPLGTNTSLPKGVHAFMEMNLSLHKGWLPS